MVACPSEVVLRAAWGSVAFPLYAISVAHANDYAVQDDYVTVSSGLLLMYGGSAFATAHTASQVCDEEKKHVAREES